MVDIGKEHLNEDGALQQKVEMEHLIPKASKLKIYIKNEGKTVINLPAISLGFLGMLGNVGFKLALKIASLDAKAKDLEKVMEAMKEFDIREVIRELQIHEPFELVYIKDEKNNTEVIIRTL